MELLLLVKLFGPTFARMLFAYALHGKIDLEFIQSGDVAETLADSLNIGGIVDGLTGENRTAKRNAEYVFETIGDEVAEKVAKIFEVDKQALAPVEQEEVVIAVKEVMDRWSLPLLVSTEFKLLRFQDELCRIKPQYTSWSDKQIAFYERMLRISAHYIFAAAEQIPHFTRDTTANLLKNSNALLTDMRKGLGLQERILSETYGSQQKTKYQRFEEDYRTQLANSLDKLRLFGVDQIDGARQPLTVAFVKMKLALAAREKENPDQMNLFQPDRDETLSVAEVFASSSRLVVVARAGFGKTTLLKWAAVQIARYLPDGDIPLWKNRIPFFMLLRDYTNRELPSLQDLPFSLEADEIKLLQGTEPDDWAIGQIRAKRAVIFLDGLDEVNDQKRQEALTWVDNILQYEPDTPIILSGRPSAIDREKTQPELSRLGFEFVMVKSMDEEMVAGFVNQWHDAISHTTCKYHDKERIPDRQEKLMDSFLRRPELQSLAETPLICAMLCALNLTELGELPRDRIQLYDRCVNLLLKRDEIRLVDLSDYDVTLRPNSARKLLGHIAYWMMEYEKSTIDRVDAERLIKGEDLDGLKIARYLAERSGLLQKQSEDVYDFLHRTFQEFLAAQYIVNRNEVVKVARQYSNEKSWRETICLLAGFVEPSDQRLLLEELLITAQENKENARSFHLLAWEVWQLLDEVTDSANDVMQQHVDSICNNGGRVLNLRNPQIQKIPDLSKLSDLQTLDLTGAQVMDVSGLSRLYNLQSLNLSSTQIIDINSLSDLTNLQSLKIRNTQIKDLSSLRQLTNLQYLDIMNTQVMDVSPLTEMSNLLSLRLMDTEIANINPLSSLINLESLHLGGTQIANVTELSKLANLRSLYLWRTKVKDISDFNRLINLESLHLSWTQVTDFSGLYELKNLKYLFLFDIQLTDLSFLENFISMSTLVIGLTEKQLIESKQYLKSCTSLGLYIADLRNIDHILELTNLHTLILDLAIIEDISHLDRLFNLQVLNLSGSRITNIRDLVGLVNLESLDLSHIQAPDFNDLVSLTNLRNLDLRGTNVEDISFLSELVNLESLYLGDTQIKDVSFMAALTNLKSLDLSNTMVADVNALRELSNLKSLDLSGSKIIDLNPLVGLTGLKTIQLRESELSDISTLDHLSDLKIRF